MVNFAKIILRGFEETGVKLPTTSRLARQIDAYLDPKGKLPQILEPDHALFQTAVEAKRDLPQVAFALRQLLPVIPREELKKRLNSLIDDKVLPQENPERSPGRDAQLELFVAALCMRARLDPVFDESPDIRCKLAGQSVGVAVKRIKSTPKRFAHSLKDHVRKAAAQIEKSGLPGIITADISQSLNPTNWRVPQEMSDASFDSACNARVRSFRSQFERQLPDWTEGKGVLGVIFIDSILRSHGTRGWTFELFPSSMHLCPFNARRRRLFESFDAQFRRAVLNPGEVVSVACAW
jgi:hypothetical protein